MSASGKFFLDTNIVIALLEGDEAVLTNLDQAREVFVPAIVFGELFFGAAKSSRPLENSAKLEQFAVGRTMLPCDLRVAREYGRLKQDLRAKGKPIPENDLWIAAMALVLDATLVARDGDFRTIEGLAQVGVV